jgi:oxygen-independent coproporphyrinogen-3 oxidase
VETVLSKQEQMFETVMMGLRLKEGICRNTFVSRWGRDLLECYPKSFETLYRSGLLAWNDDFVFCSPRGYEILNTVLEEILEEADL